MAGRFEEMGAALSAVSTAEGTLWRIYKAIVEAEANYLLGWDEHDKSRFTHLSREFLFDYDDYRKWGETPHDGIRDYSTSYDGIHVRLRTDMYRQEDWATETIILPADLIDAWETHNWEPALERFINARAAQIQEAFEESKRTQAEHEALRRQQQEERDREEYARLRAKFGD